MAKRNMPKNSSAKLSTKNPQILVKLICAGSMPEWNSKGNRPDGIFIRVLLVAVYKFMFSNSLWDMILDWLLKTGYMYKLR